MLLDDISKHKGLNKDNYISFAKSLGLQSSGHKRDLETKIYKFLLATEVSKLLDLFSKEEKLALSDAAFNENPINVANFAIKYEVSFPDTCSGSLYRKGPRAFDIICYLYRDDEACLFAKDFINKIRPGLTRPPSFCGRFKDTISETIQIKSETRKLEFYSAEKTALAELLEILSLIEIKRIKLTPKKAHLSSSYVETVKSVLSQPDFNLKPNTDKGYWDKPGAVRPYAWINLVQQFGLAKDEASTLVLTQKGKKFLETGSLSVYKERINHYFISNDRDEFNRIDNIKGQKHKNRTTLTSVSFRKMGIISSMSKWETGWISFKDAFRAISFSGGSLPVCENLWSLYFSEPRYDSVAYGESGEGDVRKQFLRVFLMEYLATLGMIDIAYTFPHDLWPELSEFGPNSYNYCSIYDGLSYVRLNALGAFILNQSNEYQENVVAQKFIKVLANGNIITEDNICPVNRAFLSKFASKISDVVWNLDDKKMSDYIERGGRVENIRSFLEEKNKGEIPPMVLNKIKILNKKSLAVSKIEKSIIVTIENNELAELLSNDIHTKRYCHYIAPNKLVLSTGVLGDFYKAAKKLGYAVPHAIQKYDAR